MMCRMSIIMRICRMTRKTKTEAYCAPPAPGQRVPAAFLMIMKTEAESCRKNG